MISVFSLSYNYKAAQTKKDEKQREEMGEMSTRDIPMAHQALARSHCVDRDRMPL
jgi:hypothetical protein